MLQLATIALLACTAAAQVLQAEKAPDEPLIAPEDVCALPKVPGPCKGSFPRYYHDIDTGVCDKFIYGGCQGNKNNFETLEACEKACPPVDEPFDKAACLLGPYPEDQEFFCKAYIPSWTYNAKAGKCEEFVYGGCGGTANIFSTEKECLKACDGVFILPPVDICELPADPGTCKGACGRYYWSPKARDCLPLGYGCCGGNANNFETRKECFQACGRSIIKPRFTRG